MNPGLYVHVPFCSRKCPYCDFYSISALNLIPDWLTALTLEAERQVQYWTHEFDTLYLGGGSPSLLSQEDLIRLKRALAPFKLSPKAEISLEANPEDVTTEKIGYWQDFGINRVSLGVQSFDNRWLHDSLGRSHDADTCRRAIDIILKSPFKLSLDLIFAHAGQTPEDWASDLDRASTCGAKHISAYILTAAPGTALARAVKAVPTIRLPSEAITAELFQLTNEALKIRGFKRYEVSNFAKNNDFCRHNLKYWHRVPYLGLGPSAHSFDGTRRWANVGSIRRWAAAMGRGQTALEFIEDINPDQVRMESIMLGLRLAEGIPASLVQSEAVESLIKDSYLVLVDGFLKPTEKGFLMSDYLARTLS